MLLTSKWCLVWQRQFSMLHNINWSQKRWKPVLVVINQWLCFQRFRASFRVVQDSPIPSFVWDVERGLSSSSSSSASPIILSWLPIPAGLRRVELTELISMIIPMSSEGWKSPCCFRRRLRDLSWYHMGKIRDDGAAPLSERPDTGRPPMVPNTRKQNTKMDAWTRGAAPPIRQTMIIAVDWSHQEFRDFGQRLVDGVYGSFMSLNITRSRNKTSCRRWIIVVGLGLDPTFTCQSIDQEVCVYYCWYSYFELNVISTFDSVREQIIPHHILQCVGSASKKDPFLCVLNVLGLNLPSQCLDPKMTSKRPKQS